MELHELHVLQRHAGPQRHRHAVAGAGVGVGRAAVDPAERRRSRGSSAPASIALSPPCSRSHAITPDAAVAVVDQLEREQLLVDGDAALDDLLVEHLDQHVAGDVGGVGRAGRAAGAERALGDAAVVRAREDRAPVLELVDVARRLGADDLDRILVAQVVGALDGVEGVLLGAVLAGVSERGVDAALGRARMAAGRMELGDDRRRRRRSGTPRSPRASPPTRLPPRPRRV